MFHSIHDYVIIDYRIRRNIDSDFNLVICDHVNIVKLTYAIIGPFILQAWISLHTVFKIAKLKSCQQHFLNKPLNLMFANNSAYTICDNLGILYGFFSVIQFLQHKFTLSDRLHLTTTASRTLLTKLAGNIKTSSPLQSYNTST